MRRRVAIVFVENEPCAAFDSVESAGAWVSSMITSELSRLGYSRKFTVKMVDCESSP